VSQPDITTTKVLPDHDPADWRDCAHCREAFLAHNDDPDHEPCEACTDLVFRALDVYYWTHTWSGRASTILTLLAVEKHMGPVAYRRFVRQPGNRDGLRMPCVRPWVPGMRLWFESGRRLQAPEDKLVEFICADPPPPLDAVRARLAEPEVAS
jgi:hypothetical protein